MDEFDMFGDGGVAVAEPSSFDAPIFYFDEGPFQPPEPDTPLGGAPGAFQGDGEISNYGTDAPPVLVDTAERPSTMFDWSQLGDLFTRAGQAIQPIVGAGRDVYDIVQGRQPRTAAAQRTAQASAAAAQKRNLLLIAGGGAALLVLPKLLGRR